MATYKVLEFFADAVDYPHCYRPGDEYPRAGGQPGEKRVAFLLEAKLIAKAVEPGVEAGDTLKAKGKPRCKAKEPENA